MHVNGKRFFSSLIVVVVVVVDRLLLLLLIVIVAVAAGWLVALLPKVLSCAEWLKKRVWCEWWVWDAMANGLDIDVDIDGFAYYGQKWNEMKWNEMKRKLRAAHVLLAARSTRMIWQQIWKQKNAEIWAGHERHEKGGQQLYAHTQNTKKKK